MIFAEERWAEYSADAMPLWARHHAEIARPDMRLAPDLATYERLDAAGALQIVTARENDALVGYQITIIKTHIHDRTLLCGYEDSYYLLPEARKGMAGVRLVRESLARLKARGVERVVYVNDMKKDVTPLFRRLGFAPTGTIYTLNFGD